MCTSVSSLCTITSMAKLNVLLKFFLHSSGSDRTIWKNFKNFNFRQTVQHSLASQIELFFQSLEHCVVRNIFSYWVKLCTWIQMTNMLLRKLYSTLIFPSTKRSCSSLASNFEKFENEGYIGRYEVCFEKYWIGWKCIQNFFHPIRNRLY